MTSTVTYQPTEDELHYTFGAHPAVAEIKPGSLLVTSTEDCFGGAVRTVDDLPSKVCQAFNPVTGPFHVLGAEPGDTLALHFAAITPARDWGMSATFPHFGALTATHTTPMLHPPLEERVWRYTIDTAAGTVTFHARRSGHAIVMPLEPMLGTVGLARPAGKPAPRSYLMRTAGTSTPRRSALAPPCTSASTPPGRCSPSATATPAKARARCAASRWRQP